MWKKKCLIAKLFKKFVTHAFILWHIEGSTHAGFLWSIKNYIQAELVTKSFSLNRPKLQQLLMSLWATWILYQIKWCQNWNVQIYFNMSKLTFFLLRILKMWLLKGGKVFNSFRPHDAYSRRIYPALFAGWRLQACEMKRTICRMTTTGALSSDERKLLIGRC